MTKWSGNDEERKWIPAFAGMTIGEAFAGMRIGRRSPQ
jgi:hypothetical protein